MPWKYNPFTDALDNVGSGGGTSYIDGEVEYHSNLPVTAGTPAVNSAFLVRKGEGLYFISRKPAGIWVRELNNGNLDDWKYAGTFSDLYRDANFRILNNADVSKEIAFSAASIATGQTRTITVPDKNITLDDAGDSRSPTSHTHGNLTNSGAVGTTANLPLKTGTNGVVEAGAFGTAAGSFCAGDDARLSDDRDPNLHAASHAAGGTDALAPSDIGAQSIFTASDTFLAASPTTLTAGRAQRITVSTVVASTTELVLPTSSNQNGDMVQIIRSSSGANQSIVVKTSAGGSTLADLGLPADAGRSFTFRYVTGPNTWLLVPIDSHPADRITSGTLDVARLPVGTGSTQVAAGNHTHVVADVTGAAASGSITTSGLTQATARILGRTSSSTGSIEEIQIGSGLSLSAGELSATGSGVTAVGASTADVLSVSGSDLVADDPNADRIVFWDDSESKLRYLEAGSGLSISGTTMTATASGGIGGGTGSTDNSILRSDGTGGSTLQDSALVIDDATTSTQANVALANNHSETNSSLVLRPKGNGAFILLKPDGTTANGNARGQFAVDLQLETNAATRVASGNYSFAVGKRCTASSLHAIAMGESCAATTNSYPIAMGRDHTVSGTAGGAFAGQGNTVSGSEGICIGGSQNTASSNSGITLGGDRGVADRAGMIAQGNGRFAANGDAQWIHMVLRAKTTTNTAVELLINNERTTNGRLTCPSGKIISGIINIHGVKSDGTASAHFVRQFQVKNVAGTSSYPYTAATIGTDFDSSTSITFNNPDANGDALSISVTGITSEIWRWTAHVSAVETAYGT